MPIKQSINSNKNIGKPTNNSINEIILTLNNHQNNIRHLCDNLEKIADSLPSNIDNNLCQSTAENIYSALKSSHDFEEKNVFSFLKTNDPENFKLSQSLERLHFEHLEDQGFAEEVCDALKLVMTDRLEKNPASTGYMLRGFFEGLRRHLAFEQEHILPILINHLEARNDKPTKPS